MEIPLISEARRREELRRAYKHVFTSPEGKLVMKDILSRGGVTTPRFVTDPTQRDFFEGQRHLAWSIFRFVHSSDKLNEMLIEQQEQMERQINEVQTT